MKYLRLFEKHQNNCDIGKKGKNMSLSDIAKKHKVSLEQIKNQIEMGKKVEMEHTNDIRIATAIAKDHLSESPTYYTDLKKIDND